MKDFAHRVKYLSFRVSRTMDDFVITIHRAIYIAHQRSLNLLSQQHAVVPPTGMERLLAGALGGRVQPRYSTF